MKEFRFILQNEDGVNIYTENRCESIEDAIAELELDGNQVLYIVDDSVNDDTLFSVILSDGTTETVKFSEIVDLWLRIDDDVYFDSVAKVEEKKGEKNMNDVKVFENVEFGSIRTLQINGEPYFVGRDVAEILGYSNSRKALADHVDEEDKGVTKCDTLGGTQTMTVINESGLYSLILSSKLPTAKKFKRWVTAEVLPSIRKHGMYATDELLANPDFAIKVFRELKAEREKRSLLETTVKVQSQQIAELQPKASYYDIVLNCKDLVSATQIAKDYGKSAKWLNEFLHNQGVQFRQSGIWILYQDYASQGYTNTKTHEYNGNDGSIHARVHTYWTQKGRLFIYGLLKEHGYLPNCELTEMRRKNANLS